MKAYECNLRIYTTSVFFKSFKVPRGFKTVFDI